MPSDACELLLVAIASVRHLCPAFKSVPSPIAQRNAGIQSTADCCFIFDFVSGSRLPYELRRHGVQSIRRSVFKPSAPLFAASSGVRLVDGTLTCSSLVPPYGAPPAYPAYPGASHAPGMAPPPGLGMLPANSLSRLYSPTNPIVRRSSSRHVLCPWNGTASWCSAIP